MLKKRHPPVGARPGTLAIHAASPRPKIHRITFSETSLVDEDVAELAALRELPPDQTSWIDVQGLGDEQVLQEIGSVFALHPLALEDVVNVPGHPKTEGYDDQLLIITRMVRPGDDCEPEQVGLVVGAHYVLTFQELYGDVLEPVRARIRAGKGTIRRRRADYLAYALWDAIIDGYYPTVERLGEELEELEDGILEQPTPELLRRLHRIRGSLLALRRAIQPQRDAVNALIRDGSPLVGDEVRVYLRDVYDHCVQTAEAIEAAREMASTLMNLYLSVVGNRTNEVMKVLTIVASIFVPLTFLAGIYGMNFAHMPELQMRWSYPLLLLIMLGVGVGMVLYFRRKGWIGSPEAGGEDEEAGAPRGDRVRAAVMARPRPQETRNEMVDENRNVRGY